MSVESDLWRARWSAIGIIVAAVLLGPFAPVAWAMVIINFFRSHDELDARVLFLKQTAATLVVIPAGVFAFFLVGETMTDPGGIRGLFLIVAWVLPAAALATMNVTWPRLATWTAGILTLVVVAMDLLYSFDAARWRAFEDNHGPVVAVTSFVVVVVTMSYAWRRPGVGGVFMLSLSAVSLVAAAFVEELVPAAIASSVVGLIPGALLILSALLARGT